MVAFDGGDGIYAAFPHFTSSFFVPEKVTGTISGDGRPAWSPRYRSRRATSAPAASTSGEGARVPGWRWRPGEPLRRSTAADGTLASYEAPAAHPGRLAALIE